MQDGVLSQVVLNNRLVGAELSDKNWSPSLNFPLVRANQLPVKSGGAANMNRLDSTDLRLNADLNQLVRELTSLCQAMRSAYERSRYLHSIVRPLLSHSTWSEAIKTARDGGRVLLTETREATILRLDIANFTQRLDSHPLEQVLADLNTLFDTLTPLVYRHHGDVDKYLGDGFLATFSSANYAVEAGCALQGAAAKFNRHQSAQGGLLFPTRVGIDTGQVAVVSLGSPDRQDRTVMGPPVNLADRLQAKAPPGRIWLSQTTFDRLHDRSGLSCLGPVKIKGRQETVVVYEKR